MISAAQFTGQSGGGGVPLPPQSGLQGAWNFDLPNLFAWSEDFTHSNGWTTTSQGTTAAIVAVTPPSELGAVQVCSLAETATTATHAAWTPGIKQWNGEHQLRVYLRSIPGSVNSWIYFTIPKAAGTISAWVNLATGLVGTDAEACIYDVTQIDSLWWRISLNFTASYLATNIIRLGLTTNDAVLSAYAGTTSSGIYVAGMQVSYGWALPNYKANGSVQAPELFGGTPIDLTLATGALSVQPADGCSSFGSIAGAKLRNVPAKGGSWTTIQAKPDSIQGIDSAGGQYLNGVASSGLTEWDLTSGSGYTGYLTWLLRYTRVLTSAEQLQIFKYLQFVYRRASATKDAYLFTSKTVVTFVFDDQSASYHDTVFPAFQGTSPSSANSAPAVWAYPTTGGLSTPWSTPYMTDMIGAAHDAWEIASHSNQHSAFPVTPVAMTLNIDGVAKTWTRASGDFTDGSNQVGINQYYAATGGSLTTGNAKPLRVIAVTPTVLTFADPNGFMTTQSSQSVTYVGLGWGQMLTSPEMLNYTLTESQSLINGVVGAGQCTDFVEPGGLYSSMSRRTARQYYNSQRNVSGSVGQSVINYAPISPHNLFAPEAVAGTWTLANGEIDVNAAVTNSAWLIIYGHVPVGTDIANYQSLITYIQGLAPTVQILTTKEALAALKSPIL